MVALSGIAGIFHLDGRPTDPVVLSRMTRAIAHRGPDGVRQWFDGAVGLGHLHLQTSLESRREMQPLASQNGNFCVALDGRIDNRTELRKALVSKGFDGDEPGDAGLVLRAYACWGEECPGRLMGDFSFAIWDSRQKQLFCARDHLGMRPFYYYHSASLFAFGSEIRAVLAVDAVPRRLNESRVVDYLVDELERDDKESTFYQGVRRLPAGHSLTVGPTHFKIRDYWDLKAPPELKLASWQEYGEAFRAVFVEAVRCRLSSTHRVGSTLSGGLDSSSVVCTTRELLSAELGEPLHTISLVDADESKCGETPYIKEVLRGGGLVPHIIRSDELWDLENAMADSDEPFEISHYFPNWFAFAAAKQAGVRVLLTGISGDHIIPPPTYMSTLLRSLNWKTLAGVVSYFHRITEEPRWRILARYGVAPIMPHLLYEGLRRVARGRGTRAADENCLLNPAFAARLGVSERLECCRLQKRNAAVLAKEGGTLHSECFRSGDFPFFFEQTDRMAASNGVEARHPFSDPRIIEFFLSLPVRMKCHVPLPKMVIREGMRGILPELVRLRTRYAHPGQAFLSALLNKYSSIPSGVLAPAAEYASIQALVREAELTPGQGWSLWRVLNLAVWMKATGLYQAENTENLEES